ncbi:hypothetical protein PInf_007634 [Phytophthora infestans]|nr:hypothetical protein PInf_007634 [Phytophthora infestans]
MTPPISLWPTESEERMKIKRVSDRSLEHFTFDGLRESDYSDFPFEFKCGLIANGSLPLSNLSCLLSPSCRTRSTHRLV